MVPNRQAVALLKAAANDVQCAERLLAAQTARNLFTDETHLRVLNAIEDALKATGRRYIRPDLVVELLPESPHWLAGLVTTEVTDFSVHLRAAVAFHDRTALVALQERAVTDLEEHCEIKPETKAALRAFLDLPTGDQMAGRRNASFRSLQNRGDGQGHLIHTGFASLDRQMAWDFGRPIGAPENRFPGGYRVGDLVVIGAESGTGKTTFSLEMALRSTWLYNQENNTKRSLVVFSEEQAAEEVAALAGMRFPGQYWYKNFAANDYDAFFFDSTDYGRPTVDAVISKLTELVRELVISGKKEGMDVQEIRNRLPLMVVVDYAKLFAAPGVPLVQGIDGLARALKGRICRGEAFQSLCMTELEGYHPAVILPTQVMRPKSGTVRAGAEWRPSNDDLADCRSIRDHADMVVLLYRDRRFTEVAISKARRGIAQTMAWTPLYALSGRWYDSVEEAQTLHGPPTERYLVYAAQAAKERSQQGLRLYKPEPTAQPA
jgi:hypothetical protein